MMKKAGAGWFVFVVGAFLLGGWTLGGGGTAFAQEAIETPAAESAVAAPAETPAEAAPEAPAMPGSAAGYEYTYPKKLAELNTADVFELRKKLEKVEAGINDVDIATSNAQVEAAREQAEANSPEVKALQAQITRLHEEIRLAVDRDPAVVAASAGANQTHMEFMDQLNFRTGLLRLIAEKERQNKWTEPESAPEEKTP